MGEIAVGVIYQITCTTNGRSYVGSTVDLRLRQRQHLHLLRKGRHHSRHMQRSFNRHGEASISWAVIGCATTSDLIAFETQVIAQERPAFNGAMLGAARLGARQSQACKAKVSAANLGRTKSDEQRATMMGNTRAVGNQNARKVTPEIRAEIAKLVVAGLGSYRIGKAVGLSKKTIINVRMGRH